jgi:hypothetical protein
MYNLIIKAGPYSFQKIELHF